MADAQTLSADSPPRPGSRRLLVDGCIVVVTLALATALFFQRGGPLSEGSEVQASFSAISPDARGAECAGDLGLADYRCRFDDSYQRDTDESRREIVPLNGDHGLMLLDGVFEQDEVRDRIDQDRPGQPRKSYDRFKIYCTLRLLHRIESVKVRWTRGAWQNGGPAWLAEAEHCTVRAD